MNTVTCLSLETGKEFEKQFYDLHEQRLFLLKCYHSKKVMVTGYTYQNQEERNYLKYGR